MCKNVKQIIVLCIFIAIFISFFSVPTYAQDDEEEIKTTIRGQLQLELIVKELLSQNPDSNITYDKVPLFYQTDYPDIPYGKHGTIASHGCGITCVAMVATYLTDIEYTPVMLASQFGSYNTYAGSKWTLFEDSAEIFGLKVENTYSWREVKRALKNDQVVIALVGSKSIFTNGGHFIVLTGITEDGKILVNDPNGYNYKRFPSEFEKGFHEHYIYDDAVTYWIYDKKEAKELPIISDDVKESLIDLLLTTPKEMTFSLLEEVILAGPLSLVRV